MPHHLGEFVIRGVELLHETAVNRHLAAGHAPCVHRVWLVDERYAPRPIPGVREHCFGLADEPPRDRAQPVCQHWVIEELVLRADIAHGCRVGALRFDDRRFRRDEHELGAPRWAGRAGAEHRGGEQRRQQPLHSIHHPGVSPHGCGDAAIFARCGWAAQFLAPVPTASRPSGAMRAALAVTSRRVDSPGRTTPSPRRGDARTRELPRCRPTWPRCIPAHPAECP